jgi:hypothetical protein
VKPSLPTAHDDVECIRERLPRQLLKLREVLAFCSIHTGS